MKMQEFVLFWVLGGALVGVSMSLPAMDGYQKNVQEGCRFLDILPFVLKL